MNMVILTALGVGGATVFGSVIGFCSDHWYAGRFDACTSCHETFRFISA